MNVDRIKLSALWVSLMLTYLLGDVLRIFSGDFSAGQISDMEITPLMYLGMAILMVIPVVLVFLSLVLPYKISPGSKYCFCCFLFWFQFNRFTHLSICLRPVFDYCRTGV